MILNLIIKALKNLKLNNLQIILKNLAIKMTSLNEERFDKK